MNQEQPVLDRAEIDSPRMVHVEANPAGCWVALCGAKLHGIYYSFDTEIDCVVCAELEKSMAA